MKMSENITSRGKITGRPAAVAAAAFLLLLLAACGKPLAVGTPEFDQALKEGEIIVLTQAVEGTDLQTVIAYAALKTDIEAFWMMIMDFNRFDEFLPRVDGMKVLRREGKIRYINMKINTFPLPDREVIIKMEASQEFKTVATIWTAPLKGQ